MVQRAPDQGYCRSGSPAAAPGAGAPAALGHMVESSSASKSMAISMSALGGMLPLPAEAAILALDSDSDLSP